MRQAIFEEETIQVKQNLRKKKDLLKKILFQSLILNSDSQYAVIGGDRGFVQVLRTHDLQPVYVYPQCDASIRSLAITHDQK